MTNEPNKSSGNTRPVIGQTLLQLGATKKKNVVVNYLLLNMAKLMVATITPDDKFTKDVQKAADQTRRRLLASHSEDELKPIKIMNDTAVAMARKLANCDDVDRLQNYLEYMNRLLKNEVYVVEDVENPEEYGLKPNV